LQKRHDSPTMLDWQWAAHACGLWVSSEGWWLDPDQWNTATTDDRLEDGDRVTLGFDGARVGDATALVACRVDDGLVQPLGIWEAPAGIDGWEVPAGQVDAAVANAFERFRVVRMYCDPPLWQSEVDGWAQEYGDVVMRFATKRNRMIDAVERFRTDLVAGRLRHVGDETLTRHCLNAQVREVRGGYWLAKPGSTAQDKIDAAVAAVLAWEARADATTSTSAAPVGGELITF